jgi:DNA replication and repair protein RecF
MYVRRLQLANFRNYSELDLTLPAGKIVLLGDNAQGKSNLLEALYLLASARSVRAGNDGEMVGWPGEGDAQPIARTAAWVDRNAGPVQVEVVIVGGAAAGSNAGLRAGKRLRVNGIPRRAVDLIGQLRAVLFRADDLAIISGGPGERRRFLDLMLAQIDRQYYAALQRFGRIVQQRNAVLRRIRERLAATEELLFWDESFAREAALILASRIRAAKRLSAFAAAEHGHLSGAAHEVLSVAYRPRLGDQWEPLLQSQDAADPAALQSLISAALVAGRRRDVAAGLSLVGPHRDDLEILIGGVSAAAFGSRAQIRTASLALRLAEGRLLEEDIGDPPVLLLDDIVSELDEGRRRSVLAGIAGSDQVWLTATDGSAFSAQFLADARVLSVSGGRVSEL